MPDPSEHMGLPFARMPTAPGVDGDFAPFPASDSAQVSPNAQNPHAFNIPQQQRHDAYWHQQPPPLRSMSYGPVEDMSGNHGNYEHSSQRPAIHNIRYPPPALNMQNAATVHHHDEPHSAPVSGEELPYSQPHPFMFQQQHSVGHPAVLQPHAYHHTWYPEQAPFGSPTEHAENMGPGHHRPE
jgi:hypothetical protein